MDKLEWYRLGWVGFGWARFGKVLTVLAYPFRISDVQSFGIIPTHQELLFVGKSYHFY